MVRKVLVTGGAGFIGSHVCEALLSREIKVACLDNFNDFYNPELKHSNVEEIYSTCARLGLPENDFTVFEGDIRDNDYLNRCFASFQPDAVVHLAAYAGVRPSIIDPVLYTDVNINGTVNILECLKRFEVKKLLFASSSSVYGNNKKVPFSESDPVNHPISPYAATKKAGELICHTYHSLYDINTACLRFFTVYGPRQRPDLAIRKFTEMILKGQEIPFYGDGSTRRDYTYIDDIIDGILKALNWVDSPEKRYDVFNLGENNTITLSKMVETIEEAVGIKAKLKQLPLQPGDVNQTYADISRSREVLGYSPHTNFYKGVSKFISWYKEHGS